MIEKIKKKNKQKIEDSSAVFLQYICRKQNLLYPKLPSIICQCGIGDVAGRIRNIVHLCLIDGYAYCVYAFLS